MLHYCCACVYRVAPQTIRGCVSAAPLLFAIRLLAAAIIAATAAIIIAAITTTITTEKEQKNKNDYPAAAIVSNVKA